MKKYIVGSIVVALLAIAGCSLFGCSLSGFSMKVDEATTDSTDIKKTGEIVPKAMVLPND